jgi:hypothetical protein
LAEAEPEPFTLANFTTKSLVRASGIDRLSNFGAHGWGHPAPYPLP